MKQDRKQTPAIMLAVTLGVIATITTIGIGTTYAQVDRNFAGQTTAQAKQDYRNEGNPSGFGEHASDPTGTRDPNLDQSGRNRLANALTSRGDPLHPSEVIGTLCIVDPSAAGC